MTDKRIKWIAGILALAFMWCGALTLWMMATQLTGYPRLDDSRSHIWVKFPQPTEAQSLEVTFFDFNNGNGGPEFDLRITGSNLQEEKATIMMEGAAFTGGDPLSAGCRVRPVVTPLPCTTTTSDEGVEQVIEAVVPADGLMLSVPGPWARFGWKSQAFQLPSVGGGASPTGSTDAVDIPGLGVRYGVNVPTVEVEFMHAPLSGGGFTSDRLSPYERLDTVNPTPDHPGSLQWSQGGDLEVSGSITDLNLEGQQSQIIFWLGIGAGMLPWLSERIYWLSSTLLHWRFGSKPKRTFLRRRRYRLRRQPQWKNRRGSGF